MTTWLGGILELTSKVRYGLTSRGAPLYRFIPYDKRYSPLAVGSSIRDYSTNVHAIVEPSKQGKPGQMNHGNLVKTFGPPTPETETEILTLTYAYDSCKELRKQLEPPEIVTTPDKRYVVEGFTFHIDPPGCLDVDDAFTFIRTPKGWRVMIHIADVAYWVSYNSEVDTLAQKRATTFYCPNGNAVAPMLPLIYSAKEASLIGGQRPALSLIFDWIPGKPISDLQWSFTRIETQESFTYDSVMQHVNRDAISALRELAVQLGGDVNDSHTWVQELMIFYNEQAGVLLREKRRGVLRRHSPPKEERLKQIALLEEKGFEHLCMESAEYCLATDDEVHHYGLRRPVYAYASSPIRRYADLMNQRILKEILEGKNTIPNPTQEDIDHLNRRQKQAKSFSRDIFFMRMLYNTRQGGVNGFVVERGPTTTKLWIPDWKRVIKLKEMLSSDKWFHITWYANMELVGWKQRVVYSAKPISQL